MKSKVTIAFSLFCIASIAGYLTFFYFQNDDSSVTVKLSSAVETEKHAIDSETPQKKLTPLLKKKTADTAVKTPVKINYEEEIVDEPVEESETVESLKEKITDIAVEYTDDLPLLDDLIQESAEEPLELWEGDWVSIDDWKRQDDSFTVEKNEDGSFELIPDKNSATSYSYNEETKEFVWELDYYGKIITHKARFISEDVMVLMKISGIKVALDIYKRDAG